MISAHWTVWQTSTNDKWFFFLHCKLCSCKIYQCNSVKSYYYIYNTFMVLLSIYIYIIPESRNQHHNVIMCVYIYICIKIIQKCELNIITLLASYVQLWIFAYFFHLTINQFTISSEIPPCTKKSLKQHKM